MRIISALVPGAILLSKRVADISHDAGKRLKWFDYYESHGGNGRQICRHFNISPDTFYRWKRRYRPDDLKSLEDRSHRPKHVRQPTRPIEVVQSGTGVTGGVSLLGESQDKVFAQRAGYRVIGINGRQDNQAVKRDGCYKRTHPVTIYLPVRGRRAVPMQSGSPGSM